jgi:membrane fusion protein (multidrug efflux system)
MVTRELAGRHNHGRFTMNPLLALPNAASPHAAPLRPLLGAIALAVTLLTACGQKADAPAAPATRPTTVGVVVLQPEQAQLSTELPGRLSSPLVAEIRPQVSGLIKARRFTEGATVKAGEPLYQIDPASYQAAYASAQAAVAKAEAVVETDQLTARRQADLAKIDAVSQQDLQDAQAALKQAQADLATARAALETARINLGYTTLNSPISGLVDVSTVTPGALVTASQTTALTTVRQINPIQVDITQSSADLLRLKRDFASGRLQKVGTDEVQVRLQLEDGSTYAHAGKLRFSGVSVNTSTGAITLRATFENPDGLLLPGMYVRAQLQTAMARDAILVPQQAVSRNNKGESSVLVVDEHNQVSQRTVVVSQQMGSRWLVDSGLKAGEKVITEGGQKIKPGDTVQPQDVGTSGQAMAASAASAASTAASGAAR